MGRAGARAIRIGLYVGLALLVSVSIAMPVGSLTASSLGRVDAVALPSSSGAITATVLWNGKNVSSYGTPSSAVTVQFNGAVDVRYFWNSTSGPVTVSDARLQIFYFGFSLVTRDIFQTPPTPALTGTFDMSWSTGALQYILEGNYRLVASLLTPNGTTEWSQAFWVIEAAPYYILALLPIILLIIAVWEIYSVATVGRQAALSAKPSGGAPPTQSPPTDRGSGSASEEPSDEASPPAGGGGS